MDAEHTADDGDDGSEEPIVTKDDVENRDPEAFVTNDPLVQLLAPRGESADSPRANQVARRENESDGYLRASGD